LNFVSFYSDSLHIGAITTKSLAGAKYSTRNDHDALATQTIHTTRPEVTRRAKKIAKIVNGVGSFATANGCQKREPQYRIGILFMGQTIK